MQTVGSQGGSAAVEVRVYKSGRLIDSKVCETEADANALIAHWSEMDDVEFEVDDLSTQHVAGDILAPDAPAANDEGETSART